MFRAVIFFFFAWTFGGSLLAQTAAPSSVNPFDLTHRLPKIAAAGGLAGSPAMPGNPFDMVPHRVPGAPAAGIQKAPGGGGGKSLVPKISVPRGKSTSKTFLFWSLVAAFGFLTFSVAANRSIVGKAWLAFINGNHLALAQREASGLLGSTPYFLLYSNFVLNAGIFAFLVTRFFRGDGFNNIGYLLLCVLGVTVVFAGKHLLLWMIGWLYPVRGEVERYNFLIIVFNCVLGLFLVPFNMLLAFARDFEPFLVFWTLGLIFVFYGYRTLRASAIGAKFLSGDQFHFLLYLCAAEVAPVFLLTKLAMLQNS